MGIRKTGTSGRMRLPMIIEIDNLAKNPYLAHEASGMQD
jgi:hypothetical protein